MDYIREFDIRLEKEMYYAGETLSGVVILDTVENFKLRSEPKKTKLIPIQLNKSRRCSLFKTK